MECIRNAEFDRLKGIILYALEVKSEARQCHERSSDIFTKNVELGTGDYTEKKNTKKKNLSEEEIDNMMIKDNLPRSDRKDTFAIDIVCLDSEMYNAESHGFSSDHDANLKGLCLETQQLK